jgi:hypothetical protein
MATLNDLAKKVRNTKNRLSNLFIQVWTGSAYEFRNMGRITGAEFTSEPVTSEADQDGRESSQLFDITVSWSLMQTSNEELSLMGELAIPSDVTNFPNGHRIYASGNKLQTSELNNNLTSGVTGLDDGQPDYTQLNSVDPDGLYFRNVLLKPSPEVNLSGEDAMINIEFTGTVETDALDGFDDTNKEDANWIVVSPE